MRRDADIIGYMYNDTEAVLREKIATDLEDAMEAQEWDVANFWLRGSQLSNVEKSYKL